MPPHDRQPPRRPGTVRSRQARRTRRRRLLLLAAGVIAAVLVLVVTGAFRSSRSFRPPSRASLAGLSLGRRIVAIANSQVGYSTRPKHSYCNKFSAYWQAGKAVCPHGEASEEWCADFAAWAWQKAGAQFGYGYEPGEINAGAVSFYQWGAANGRWHPVGSGYVAQPGDVAVYGLQLGEYPTAAHVAIVTGDSSGQRGPDVINGDGDRTGFSVVETGTDQTKADVGQHEDVTLAGYVSPP
jgi:hypothetical protein